MMNHMQRDVLPCALGWPLAEADLGEIDAAFARHAASRVPDAWVADD